MHDTPIVIITDLPPGQRLMNEYSHLELLMIKILIRFLLDFQLILLRTSLYFPDWYEREREREREGGREGSFKGEV